MTSRRSLLANTVASGIATVVTIGIIVGLSPYLLRAMGPASYGAWVLLTVVLVQGRGFASLLDFGLQQSLIQRIADAPDPETASRRLGAGTRALVAIGLVAGGVLVVAAAPIVHVFKIPPGVEHSAVLGLRLLGLQLAIEMPGLAFGSAVEGLQRYDIRRGIDVVRALLFAVMAVLFVANGAGPAGLALASLVSCVVSVAAMYVATRRLGLRPASGHVAHQEMRLALPLVALRATGVGYRQLDKVVLGLIIGTVATAGFDVAEKANLVALTLLGIGTSALIPAAARGFQDDPARTRDLVLTATYWTALVAAPVAGLTFGLAGPLAQLIAGQTIPGSVAAIRWLAPTTAIACIYSAGFEMSIGAAGARRLAPLSIAGLAINLIATIWLVHLVGLPGSAAASLIATAALALPVTVVVASILGHHAADLARAARPGLLIGVTVGLVSLVATGDRSDFAGLLRGAAAGVLAGAAVSALLVRRPPRAALSVSRSPAAETE